MVLSTQKDRGLVIRIAGQWQYHGDRGMIEIFRSFLEPIENLKLSMNIMISIRRNAHSGVRTQ
jgi:hypothetical protein